MSVALCFSFLTFCEEVQFNTDSRNLNSFKDFSKLKIVSLVPSVSESVCALGACNNLIGVDKYSNWPNSINHLPKLGGLIDTNIESIVNLKPDLILLSRSSPAKQKLQSLGFWVESVDIQNLEDLHRTLILLSKILQLQKGDAKAEQVWQDIQNQIQLARLKVPKEFVGTTVYFEASAGGYAAAPSSFIGELLTQLGLVNIVPADAKPFIRLNPEFVVRSNPSIIMATNDVVDDFSLRAGWAQLKAISENKVCHFKEESSDLLVRPGPRIGLAAHLIAECLRTKVTLKQLPH
jgi:iron complex transport system substrate-binding protein